MHFNTVDFASSKLKGLRILFFTSGLTLDPVKNNNEITMGWGGVLKIISLDPKTS